jgi:hypothetical protein
MIALACSPGSQRPGRRGALDDVTIQAVADIADRNIREAIDRYQAQRGAGQASTGLTDVVAHLQRGQIDTVLLVDDLLSMDMLWIDPDDPTLVSVDDHVLHEAGVRTPLKVRADAALLRAIAGTGAHLILVGAEEAPLNDGIAGVLRYADASSAADGSPSAWRWMVRICAAVRLPTCAHPDRTTAATRHRPHHRDR